MTVLQLKHKKLKMKLYESKKLHYNKYLYRLEIPNRFAHIFRTEFQKNGKLAYARSYLDELHNDYDPGQQYITLTSRYNSWQESVPVEHYFDAIIIYRTLLKAKDFLVRVGNSSLNVYSNDRKFLVKFGNNLNQKYVSLFEPDPANVPTLLVNENIIITNKPPKYEYKITMGKKRGNPALAKWIEGNPNLAKIGPVALHECYNEGYVKGYYFYVKNKKTLSLIMMIVGDNIQRVDRLVQST